MAVLVIPAFLLLMLIAPVLFGKLFGQEWEQAGVMARILSPWLCLNIFASVISQVPMIIGKQKGALIISIKGHFIIMASAGVGWWFNLDILQTLIILSVLMSIYTPYVVHWTLKITKQDDMRRLKTKSIPTCIARTVFFNCNEKPEQMKIIISGLPYFAKKLAGQLSDYDKSNYYVAISNDGLVNRMRVLTHLLSADVVYMIGGAVTRSNLVDLAMLLRKKIVMHWVGTDVSNAQKAIENKLAIPSYVAYSTHWCEVDWIQEELGEIGIKAEIVSIASVESSKFDAVPPLPENFSVLSYIGKGREKFYGIDLLIKLAEAMPEIPIKIAGISEYSECLPANIELLGWVDDMDKAYRDCVIFLRLAEHDGLAFSVLEALSNGRYVGYSYRFLATRKISSQIELVEYVTQLKSLFNNGQLGANEEGVEQLKSEYKRATVAARLIAQIKQLKSV